MKTNHYGRTIDSETPITGVFNNNNLEWIWEEVDSLSSIDPDWYKFRASEEFDPDAEYYDYEQSTALIGFVETTDKSNSWYWFDKLRKGLMIDPDAEYSAIVNLDSFNTTQVVKSKWFIKSALCSPCYPGQADADTAGEYLAFSLPPDVIGDNYELRRRVFSQND